MTTTAFLTDSTLCIGCKACEVACKEWNELDQDGLDWSGFSYDNTRAVGHSTWRHVKFVESAPQPGSGGNDPVYPPGVFRQTFVNTAKSPDVWRRVRLVRSSAPNLEVSSYSLTFATGVRTASCPVLLGWCRRIPVMDVLSNVRSATTGRRRGLRPHAQKRAQPSRSNLVRSTNSSKPRNYESKSYIVVAWTTPSYTIRRIRVSKERTPYLLLVAIQDSTTCLLIRRFPPFTLKRDGSRPLWQQAY